MREVIRFLMDGRTREIVNPDPTLTVLDYLRGELRRSGIPIHRANAVEAVGEGRVERIRFRAGGAWVGHDHEHEEADDGRACGGGSRGRRRA